MAFRDVQPASGVAGTNGDGQLPAAVVDGDQMFAVLINDGSANTITTPAAGWNLLQTMPPAGMDFSAWLYERVKQAGDGNPTWVFSGGAWAITIPAYSAVSAIDDSDVSTVTIAAASIVTPAVTPIANDDTHVVFGMADAAAPARTWTEDVAMNERFEGIGQTLHHLVADELLSGGAGVPVSRTLTLSGTVQQLGAFGVLLAPAATGPALDSVGPAYPQPGRKSYDARRLGAF